MRRGHRGRSGRLLILGDKSASLECMGRQLEPPRSGLPHLRFHPELIDLFLRHSHLGYILVYLLKLFLTLSVIGIANEIVILCLLGVHLAPLLLDRRVEGLFLIKVIEILRISVTLELRSVGGFIGPNILPIHSFKERMPFDLSYSILAQPVVVVTDQLLQNISGSRAQISFRRDH